MSVVRFRPKAPYADVAHLVERNLAKVEVAGSSPVIRSNGVLSCSDSRSAFVGREFFVIFIVLSNENYFIIKYFPAFFVIYNTIMQIIITQT